MRKVGHQRKAKDSEVATSGIDIALEIADVMTRLSASGHTLSVQQDYVLVPDAMTLKVFLKQAKKAYREAHKGVSLPGRPSEEANAFLYLLQSFPEPHIHTQGDMVKALRAKMHLSRNTAYKYVKLYSLAARWDPDETQFTEKERKWFAKNNGANAWDRLFFIRPYLKYKRRLEESGGTELF